ncbi:hydrogen gas-evolving membrane-bound hydrogenase subunit E [Lamprobacter modestohalophilus]|uniref:hydrogen gas-evolving membrane-bound hydrogenase subunit E n=1 Tax=Lamprobacter modestohalophilus TaxID=1064514 RepID=UPI002ADEB353|nr:hydrogen gas-evolving membrane-bound hydrogenase subunit E [Lamprobacter modestohalophilus]MEA1052092.1 hydrogen gas-evolving membrane-bound hydrogenase subunit E [Lamprobacter modestohalophilus]
MTLVLIIAAPLLAAVLAVPAQRVAARAPSLLAVGAGVMTLAAALLSLSSIAAGEIWRVGMSWLPTLGLELALRLDDLALLMVLLVSGIGLLVNLYARYYLPEDAPRGRFFALMLLFQAAMLGLVMADNLLLLLIFWELTSLLSFLLIGFDSTSAEARRGARTALLVTASGGLALLAAFLLLGSVVGSFSISEVLAAGEQVRADPLLLPILLLILLGVATKSAQVPFHVWLPAAMAAPTPVSAYLHSATMVKAGVFLLARLFPVFAESPPWVPLVGGLGLTTFVFGAYAALFQQDLKGLLAYSTISHLGLITFLFGLGTPLGAVAGLFHLINHTVFKASLFMAVGIIDHETGSRDLRRLRGLYAYLPITGGLAMIAAAAMAGVPLLNGFLSKEMFFSETLHSLHIADWPLLLKAVLPIAAILGAVLSVAYSLRFIHDTFFNGPYPVDDPELRYPPHEPAEWMRLPVEVLAALCVVIGVLPQQTIEPILQLGVIGMLGDLPEFHLAIWHGLSPAFLMSGLVLAGGVLIYVRRRPLFAAHERHFPEHHFPEHHFPDRHFPEHHFQDHRAESLSQQLTAGLLGLGRRLHPWLQPVSLQHSTAWLLAAGVGLGILGWLAAQPPTGSALAQAPNAATPTATTPASGAPEAAVLAMPIDIVSIAAAVVLVAATFILLRQRAQRVFAVVLTGVIGLIVSLAFVHFSAPDLALTQLAVELVTTLLLVLVLAVLPRGDSQPVAHWRRRRDLFIAALVGSGSAALTVSMLQHQTPGSGEGYLRLAEPAAGAANAVNAILVDFRAFDTLGEITVLTIAAATVMVLLAGLQLPPLERIGDRARESVHPLLFSMVSRPVLPAALMLAAYLLLRGHQAPGGGFVAGLIIGTAFIVQQIATGRAWSQRQLHRQTQRLIGAGLLLALATGLAALLFGRPFLTSAFWHGSLPLLGELRLTSTLLFDIGVMMIVSGTLLLVLDGLGRVGASGNRDTRGASSASGASCQGAGAVGAMGQEPVGASDPNDGEPPHLRSD